MPCTVHIPVPRSQIGRHRSRRPVGLAGHMHDPAHALRDQVKAAAPGIGPVITEPGELGVDQPRVELVQCVEAEPGARHHGRPVVLDQHVHGFDEPQEQRLPSKPLVIERDALLVAVDVAETGVALGAALDLLRPERRSSGCVPRRIRKARLFRMFCDRCLKLQHKLRSIFYCPFEE